MQGSRPFGTQGRPYRRKLSSPVCKHHETVKNPLIGTRKLGLSSIPDIHLRSCLHQIEQFQQVLIPHADAADGAGFTHFHAVRSAMNVDIPAHGVHLSQAIEARLTTGEP
jgi:hypothetical protein